MELHLQWILLGLHDRMNTIRRTRRKTQRKMKTYHTEKSLQTSYGVVILPKGFRLYHASTSSLCALPNKPVIFTTLHPSEWYIEDSYITVIELQREVSLLFMIQTIQQMRVFSSLNTLLGIPNSNLVKMNYESIKSWIPFLAHESLDGWVSSIENKTAVEIALRNDPDMIKMIDCEPIRFNWTNSIYDNNYKFVPKKWGTTYSLYSRTMPVRMLLNSRFKPLIETYLSLVGNLDYQGTTFSILLENADISYIDAPVENIRWSI